MKKILVALAVVALASPAFAALSGSKHDFSWQTSYAITGQPKCQYCHVPHNAQTWANTALWARPQATGLTWYSGDAIQTNADRQGTATCLSCHADTTTSGLLNPVAGNSMLGKDMRNDHPVAADANATLGTVWNLRNDTIVLGRATWTAGGTMRVQCASCHNVHNGSGTSTAKLLFTNGSAGGTAQDLCSTCHGV